MAFDGAITITKKHDYFINEGNKLGYMEKPAENTDPIKIVAGEALKKGEIVYVHDQLTNGDISVKKATATAGLVPIGVAMFDCKKDEEIAVETEGLFKLVAGGTLSAGDKIYASSGKPVAFDSTASAPNSEPCGVALTDATSGDYVYVKFSI